MRGLALLCDFSHFGKNTANETHSGAVDQLGCIVKLRFCCVMECTHF